MSFQNWLACVSPATSDVTQATIPSRHANDVLARACSWPLKANCPSSVRLPPLVSAHRLIKPAVVTRTQLKNVFSKPVRNSTVFEIVSQISVRWEASVDLSAGCVGVWRRVIWTVVSAGALVISAKRSLLVPVSFILLPQGDPPTN